ncbi:hypothetical protein IVB69_06010 [Flavobacterium sp. J49]|uniref:hypothetical protein n=1 Tax=Flavobacterium sp. J49 TaxID=2718534 RepID=UPI0015932434|nr:hypothetical protein [Flavobacterium sp. J49]MBF6641028.1 hypothetical protein [Flavobacterium sp. J49]NIC02275.1 hypothetical protein [Flavobacterium sp. J49]
MINKNVKVLIYIKLLAIKTSIILKKQKINIPKNATLENFDFHHNKQIAVGY